MQIVPTVYACEECPTDQEIGLHETVDRSDLIIVGYRSDANAEEYPQTIEITARQILKGELSENPIEVESFTSDCEYGLIILDDADYLIFLRKEGAAYAPIKDGCAVTKMPYAGVNLDEFMATYLGEEAVELAPTPTVPAVESNWPLLGLGIGIGVALALGVLCLIGRWGAAKR